MSRVVALSMSPVDDMFLSGSLDKTLRLWDLRSPNCQGLMHLSSRPVAAFDPEGLVFAAGVNSESVKLYDLRSFDKGPFASFRLMGEKGCEWTGLKFSPDGKTILLSTNGSVIRLIDAFHGNALQTFTGHLNNKGIALEASYSPDSQFVFSGSVDGKLHVWHAESGHKVCSFNADHTGPVQCVQFNPKYMMLASGCTNMVINHFAALFSTRYLDSPRFNWTLIGFFFNWTLFELICSIYIFPLQAFWLPTLDDTA